MGILVADCMSCLRTEMRNNIRSRWYKRAHRIANIYPMAARCTYWVLSTVLLSYCSTYWMLLLISPQSFLLPFFFFFIFIILAYFCLLFLDISFYLLYVFPSNHLHHCRHHHHHHHHHLNLILRSFLFLLLLLFQSSTRSWRNPQMCILCARYQLYSWYCSV